MVRSPRPADPNARRRRGRTLAAVLAVLGFSGCTLSARSEPDPADLTWEQAWQEGSVDVLQSWFAANTGPTIEPTRTVTGVQRIDSQEAADELVGTTVRGRVEVVVDDVRVRDFVVVNDGSGTESVSVEGGLSGVVLEHFEVDGQGHLSTLAAVGGGPWARVVVRNAYIHDSLDGVRLFEGSVHEYLLVEDAVVNPDYVPGTSSQHADAAQAVRAGPGEPLVLRRSFLDHSAVGDNITSVVLIKPDAGEVSSVLVGESYLNGGRYTVIVESGDFGTPADVVVRNNRFGRDHQQGVWSGEGVEDGRAYDRGGNLWADTSDPVTNTWGRLRDE